MTEPRDDLARELANKSMARDAGATKHDPGNGQFTSGGGAGGGGGGRGAGGSSSFKAPPGMDPLRAKALAGGAQPNPREVAQMKNHERYPDGPPPLRHTTRK